VAASWALTLRLGPLTLSNCTVTTADTALQCTSEPTSPAAAPGTLPVAVTAAGATGPVPALRLRTPCLSSVNVQTPTGDAATSGGDTVLLTGRNLGPLGSVVDLVVYGAGVVLVTEAAADNVTALAAAAVAASAGAGGSGTPGALWRALATGAVSAVAALGAAGAGAGPGAVAPTLYFARNCVVQVVHVTVACVMAPGVGRGHVWALGSPGPALSTLCTGALVGDVTTGYAPPRITGVVVVGQRDAPGGGLQTEGGSVVVVTGVNFGGGGAGASLGGLPVPSFVLLNDSAGSLLAPPGFGAGVGVMVTVGGQVSNVFPVAYDAPRVTSVTVLPGRVIG
jgi:hypothetical protein